MHPDKATNEQLNNRFDHHPPKGNQAERYAVVRDAVKLCASTMRDICPPSRELSRAYNALDEAMMLANASIARNE